VHSHDVIVVGNGVLGYSTVLALLAAHPTVEIAVVGPVDRRGAASPAAGAMLGCFGEVTRVQLASAYGREKLSLAVQSTALWPEWLAAINEDATEDQRVVITPGTFVVLNARSSGLDDENYVAIEQALAQHGRIAQSVDLRSVPGLDPLEDCRPLRSMYLPDEGSVDSSRLLTRLSARIAASPRVTSIEGVVESLRVSEPRIQGVTLRDGRALDSGAVVLAAGFESQRILDTMPELARRIPRLFPGAGTSLLLQPIETDSAITSVIRTPNRSFACGLHVVPRANGRLYVGATNHLRLRSFEAPTAYDVHFLLECTMDQIRAGLHAASIVATNVGHRPVSIDGFPLVGPTSVDGLWLMTGTYRDGLHLSPLLARSVARELLGEKAVLTPSFVPERRPIVTMTREQAIAEAVKHQLAIGHEHAMRLPRGWHPQLAERFADLVRSIYDMIGGDLVLPPEFVPMFISSNARDDVISFFQRYYASVAGPLRA